MPQIIVVADRPADKGEAPVMLRERVSASDLESAHFARQLIERLGWAVGDAHAFEAPGAESDAAEIDADELEAPEPDWDDGGRVRGGRDFNGRPSGGAGARGRHALTTAR